MVKNLPCNAGDVGLIPGQGTKISCAEEQQVHVPKLLNLCVQEPVCDS